MSIPPKTYRVCFTATSSFKIKLNAASKAQAVATARRLWNRKGEAPFSCFAGDTDGWVAMEERS
jgi:hypothetical protein